MLLPELREEVYLSNMELPKNDLVKMTSGNVSGRDPETNLVVIKPSGVAYEKLTPDNMVVVNLDGEVIEGQLLPSIDTTTHVYVYQNRPDINGMVHTHSPFVNIFAVLGKPIPATLTSCGLVGGTIPLGGYYPRWAMIRSAGRCCAPSETAWRSSCKITAYFRLALAHLRQPELLSRLKKLPRSPITPCRTAHP